MSHSNLRRIVISSDEDEDESANAAAKEFISEDEEDDEVIDDSLSPNRMKSGSSHSSFMASTPVSKTANPLSSPHFKDELNDSFDRMSVQEGGRTAASRSVSNSSQASADHDRSRSFIEPTDVKPSPISARLALKDDAKSKQALRERLLKKQFNANRNHPEDSGRRSHSTLNAAVKSEVKPEALSPLKDIANLMEHESAGGDQSSASMSEGSLSTLSVTKEDRSLKEEPLDSTGSPAASSTSSRSSPSSGARRSLRMSDVFGTGSSPSEASNSLNREEQFKTPRKSTAAIPDSDEEEAKQEEEEAEEEEEEEEEEGKISEDEEEDAPLTLPKEEEKDDMELIVIEDSDDDEKPPLAVQPRPPPAPSHSPAKAIKAEKDVIVISSSSSDTAVSPPPSATPDFITAPGSPYKRVTPPASPLKNGVHPSTLPSITDLDGFLAGKERDLARLLELDRKAMKLPDGGAKLDMKIAALMDEIEEAKKAMPARRVAPPAPKPKLDLVAPPSIHPDAYNKLLTNDKKKLFGGQMTDERLKNINRVTGDVIKNMHAEVTTQPDGVVTETPKGLKVELMNHQKTGLTWMMWREQQQAPGGILADDMGLGKTVSMISLILAKKNRRLEEEEDEEEEKKRRKACSKQGLIPSFATLVVAPASVIFQWQKEAEDRVKGSRLRHCVLHGPRRETNPKKLAAFDIVITTYNIITSELTEKVDMTRDNDSETESDDDDDRFGQKAAVAKESNKKKVSKKSNSVLTKIAWERIILDEAHQIKNRNALISKAVCRIPATFRWCLTGTPVHNNLWDLFSLVRFLRVSPFDEVELWKQYVMGHGGDKRLNTLVKSLLLRRTKQQTDAITNKPIVALKEKQYKLHTLEMTGLELSIYSMIFDFCKAKVLKMVNEQQDQQDLNTFGVRRRKKNRAEGEPIRNPFAGGPREYNSTDKFQQMSCILVFLLRLRQAAVHLALTKDAMDLESFEGLGMETASDEVATGLAEMSLDEEGLEGGDKKEGATMDDINKIFAPKYMSTKMKALMELIDHVISVGDKCVVVSQWTTVLNIVEYHIKRRGVMYTAINGDVLTKDRQERVDSFNRVNGGAQVMLLSLAAGGVGLNLIGGNHLFLVDLHWNPALEAQACDRIYRMGQTKNVYIHKLLATGTVEGKVLALQEQKSELARSVLEGAANKNLNKLTMADLKFLFELDGGKEKAQPSKSAEGKGGSGAPPVVTL